MANDCSYEMKIRGSKDAIQRVVDCLNAEYDYDKGQPEHKHFFRVFGAYEDEEEGLQKNTDGTFTLLIYGSCAWSVFSCMCEGAHSYYTEIENRFPNTFMGTTLKEQSQDCEIEVFSEEPGMMFSEHYLYKKGECLVEDCISIKVEDVGDDYIIINPNRRRGEYGYRWRI